MRISFLFLLTLLLMGCASSPETFLRNDSIVAGTRYKYQNSSPLSQEQAAKIGDFLVKQNWRHDLGVSSPDGYTGIKVELLTKSGKKLMLSLYSYAGYPSSLFMSTPSNQYVTSISGWNERYFLSLAGSLFFENQSATNYTN